MGEVMETVKHKRKGSTLKWFIFALIPILNLYVLWKVAELLSAHERATIILKEKERVDRLSDISNKG